MNEWPKGIEGVPTRFCAKCEFCSFELDIRLAGVHQWTSGWVMQREDGGGHGISLPKREHRFAHRQCVERAVKGQTGQIGLFPTSQPHGRDHNR